MSRGPAVGALTSPFFDFWKSKTLFGYIFSGIFKMSSACKILSGLADQQKDGILCDVELVAEGQRIKAHKNVLASATHYFEAMFNGKFEEISAKVVEVKGVTFTGLKAVVDCIYTSTIKIIAANIEDILSAAHLIQMTGIVDECNE